ncbi:MAG: GNAT family N-acetyltransferase [Elusimicrobia bacterium]|nr:GNAT family N-acetyltransferase [Elusimicrobiota bacterium]
MLRYLSLRDPSPDLLKKIIGLYKAAGWHEPSDTTGRYRRMVRGSHCFLLAMDKDGTAGMARAVSDGANDAYIQDVFVLPGRRRSGIATALVRTLLAQLKKDRLKWIGLISHPKAARLYKACGFRKMRGFAPMRLSK